MNKKKLIQRLNRTYLMEKFNAFITFPAFTLYLIITNHPLDILFLLYGMILCIFILIQGQFYFKIKLLSLKGKTINQNSKILLFRKFERIDILLIGFIPIILIIQLLLNNWTIKSENLMFWGFLMNAFSILEYINYYKRQLMIDNSSDLNYVIRNRKLKISSLAKDISENKI